MKFVSLAAITSALMLIAGVSAQPQISASSQALKVNPNVVQLAKLPDLVVDSIKLRPIGGTAYAYVCVRNANPSATGPFDVQLTMQAAAPTGSPPISWAVLVGKIRYPAFSATTSFVCNDFMLPEGKMPNCVKFVAMADVGREVTEINESNNSKEIMSACLAEPPKLPASLPRLSDVPRIPIKP